MLKYPFLQSRRICTISDPELYLHRTRVSLSNKCIGLYRVLHDSVVQTMSQSSVLPVKDSYGQLSDGRNVHR